MRTLATINEMNDMNANVTYRNPTKGKGMMVIGGFLAVCGFFGIFAIGTTGAGVMLMGVALFGVGKIKNWWYNG